MLIRTLLLVSLLAALLLEADDVSVASGPTESDENWTVLFDGSSLASWKGYRSEEIPSGWIVKDGTLTHSSGEVDLLTRDTFADFDLQFEWRIATNGNSGVIYRCGEVEPASYMTGPEYQLVDNGAWGLDGKHPEASGALYGIYTPAIAANRPAGDWNSGRIVARRGRIEHWLNGKLVVTAELDTADFDSRISGTKFENWKRFGTLMEGHIALQAHKGRDGAIDPVSFRNIRIRRID